MNIIFSTTLQLRVPLTSPHSNMMLVKPAKLFKCICTSRGSIIISGSIKLATNIMLFSLKYCFAEFKSSKFSVVIYIITFNLLR